MINDYYNNEIDLTFSPAQHRYRAKENDGKSIHVPGVTTIIKQMNKPALMPWVAKQCGEWLDENWNAVKNAYDTSKDSMIREMKGHYRQSTDKAANTGTISHEWIERHISGVTELRPDNPESAAAISAFFEWWHGHDIKVVASEKVLFSRRSWYAGTVDLICEVDGVLTIVDFKTSKNIYSDMGMQLAAYQEMWVEMTRESRPIQRLIVNITKEGKLRTKLFNNPLDFDAFHACLTLYRWDKETSKESK